MNSSQKEFIEKMKDGDFVDFKSDREANAFMSAIRYHVKSGHIGSFVTKKRKIRLITSGRFCSSAHRVWLLDRDRVERINAGIARNLSS